MRPIRFVVILMLVWTALVAGTLPASAQEDEKTFAVLPFEIHGPQKYAYLGKGIQSMLTSRLSWKGHFRPLEADAVEDAPQIPDSASEAEPIRKRIGADYLFWGTLTILGENASIDLRAVGGDSGMEPASASVPLDDLIPALENLVAGINREVFRRPEETPATAEPTRQENPAFVYAETPSDGGTASGSGNANPQFRYQQGTSATGEWRSQSLPFVSHGLAVADVDGNGSMEFFFLRESSFIIYRHREGRLAQVAEHEFSKRFTMIRILAYDLNRDERPEIIVTGYDEHGPRSHVLTMKGGKITVLAENLALFINAVRLPPLYREVLVGQEKGAHKLWDRDVREIYWTGQGFDLGAVVHLPEYTNVYNFSFLPEGDSHVVVVSDDSDHLKVYAPDNETRLALTDDTYAGSALGISQPSTIRGLGKEMAGQDPMSSFYFIPTPLLPAKISSPQKFELVVCRNVSVSSQFFERYRTFPQSEMHSLAWDGVGLNMLWKTRRYKGTVADYGIADIDNDGVRELYILLNTFTGLGISHSRSVLYAYDLASPSP